MYITLTIACNPWHEMEPWDRFPEQGHRYGIMTLDFIKEL